METTITLLGIEMTVTHTCGETWPSISEAFIKLEDLDLFMLETSNNYPLIDTRTFAPKVSKTNGTWYADVADVIDACGSYVNSERVRTPALYDIAVEELGLVPVETE